MYAIPRNVYRVLRTTSFCQVPNDYSLLGPSLPLFRPRDNLIYCSVKPWLWFSHWNLDLETVELSKKFTTGKTATNLLILKVYSFLQWKVVLQTSSTCAPWFSTSGRSRCWSTWTTRSDALTASRCPFCFRSSSGRFPRTRGHSILDCCFHRGWSGSRAWNNEERKKWKDRRKQF